MKKIRIPEITAYLKTKYLSEILLLFKARHKNSQTVR